MNTTPSQQTLPQGKRDKISLSFTAFTIKLHWLLSLDTQIQIQKYKYEIQIRVKPVVHLIVHLLDHILVHHLVQFLIVSATINFQLDQ